MIKVPLRNPIKPGPSPAGSTGVKQFASFLVAVFFLVLSPEVFAQSRCGDLFDVPLRVSERDTLLNTKAYYSYLHKYGKKAPDHITVTNSDGSTSKIKTPDAFREQLNPTKALDIGTMGILGKVFDLKHNPEGKRTTSQVNEFFYRQELTKARERLEKSAPKPSPEFEILMNDLLQVEKVEGGFVTVKMDLGDRRHDDKSELIRNLRSRFMTSYLLLANWSYRLSGLETNKALSNMNMMDEIHQIAVRDLRTFKLTLIFDEQVWNQQLRVLESRVNEYQAAYDPKMQQELLGEIASLMDPYLPLSGVAVTYSLIDRTQPMEIKRYFKNDHQDPLNLMRLQDKNEFQVRHKMIYKMIESLPEGQQLEIHAHTLVHARAYLKLGFHKAGTIMNPQYPGVEIHLLKATREEALAKIAAILDESK